MANPRSVVDVGCGTGSWLAAVRAHGVPDVVGIDGPYVNPVDLEIPSDRFIRFDLTRPFRLDRRFDIVLSLEVAEHLPSACAAQFVESLVRLGPAVLFSAAVPFQGGTFHLNEQWPEYWARLFASQGYAAVDWLRELIWTNPHVEWWYVQNAFLFAHPSFLDMRPALGKHATTDLGQLARIHPRLYLEKADPELASPRKIAAEFPVALRSWMRHRRGARTSGSRGARNG